MVDGGQLQNSHFASSSTRTDGTWFCHQGMCLARVCRLAEGTLWETSAILANRNNNTTMTTSSSVTTTNHNNHNHNHKNHQPTNKPNKPTTQQTHRQTHHQTNNPTTSTTTTLRSVAHAMLAQAVSRKYPCVRRARVAPALRLMCCVLACLGSSQLSFPVDAS